MSSASSSFPPPPTGLKRWRRYRDFTQAQLGAALGVHQATISGWEHARVQPRLDQAQRLRQILDAPSIEALFPAADEKNGAPA